MTTTKNANAVNTRIDALEAKLDKLISTLAAQQAPADKPKAKAKQAAPAIKCRIVGKPSKLYIERDWVWAKWASKPTDATIAKLKAAGWHFSVKRQAWHRVNTAD